MQSESSVNSTSVINKHIVASVTSLPPNTGTSERILNNVVYGITKAHLKQITRLKEELNSLLTQELILQLN